MKRLYGPIMFLRLSYAWQLTHEYERNLNQNQNERRLETSKFLLPFRFSFVDLNSLLLL